MSSDIVKNTHEMSVGEGKVLNSYLSHLQFLTERSGGVANDLNSFLYRLTGVREDPNDITEPMEADNLVRNFEILLQSLEEKISHQEKIIKTLNTYV